MTQEEKDAIRDVLVRARAHIAEVATDQPCQPGCLEDGLMRATQDRSWFAPTTFTSMESEEDYSARVTARVGQRHELRQHPAYRHVVAQAQDQGLLVNPILWELSDRMTKAERLAFLDDAIAGLA